MYVLKAPTEETCRLSSHSDTVYHRVGFMFANFSVAGTRRQIDGQTEADGRTERPGPARSPRHGHTHRETDLGMFSIFRETGAPQKGGPT